MQLLYYLVIATPSPIGTILDFYLLRPLFETFQPKYNASTFALRDRLGGGNFGVVYEAVQRRGAHAHTLAVRLHLALRCARLALAALGQMRKLLCAQHLTMKHEPAPSLTLQCLHVSARLRSLMGVTRPSVRRSR